MKIKLENVRLSFPALFKPRAFEDGGEAKYSATFLLDKKDHAATIKAVEAAILEVGKAQWKGTLPKAVKLCLRDGAEKDHVDGYGEDIMFISANSSKRIPIVNRKLEPLAEEDGGIFAGCYVNATLRLWAQDNQFGKRVNAQLQAVQFVRDGAPFGEKPVDPNEEFEAMDDDEASMLG